MVDSALPALIQQMCQPGFYPHPVVEPIQLVQTHVSYVLLTGDYAYKVKKPVNFGFLDYSTLEKNSGLISGEPGHCTSRWSPLAPWETPMAWRLAPP
jgi:hypothetical protein